MRPSTCHFIPTSNPFTRPSSGGHLLSLLLFGVWEESLYKSLGVLVLYTEDRTTVVDLTQHRAHCGSGLSEGGLPQHGCCGLNDSHRKLHRHGVTESFRWIVPYISCAVFHFFSAKPIQWRRPSAMNHLFHAHHTSLFCAICVSTLSACLSCKTATRRLRPSQTI